jgi:hypothetical protein
MKLIVDAGSTKTHWNVDGKDFFTNGINPFFQNLTSLGVFYFTVNPYCEDGTYDLDFLNKQKAEFESAEIRHIHLKKPLFAKVNGRKAIGVILKF